MNKVFDFFEYATVQDSIFTPTPWGLSGPSPCFFPAYDREVIGSSG